MRLARRFPVLSWQVFINGYLVENRYSPFSRWQRLARCIASITIALRPIFQVVIIIPVRFSYAFWRSQFTLLFGKVLKSDMRVDISQIENPTPTSIRTWHFCHVWYNKGTKFIVCLSVSPLVVRRTFFIKDFKGHCLVSDNTYYFLKPK